MIDTHIPPPQVAPRTRTQMHRGNPPLPRCVLAAMSVNDSVHVVGDARVVQNARNAASVYGRMTGWQFVTRAEGAGIRIWRIS